MSPHFCKVGKTKPSSSTRINSEKSKNKFAIFLEDTTNTNYSRDLSAAL